MADPEALQIRPPEQITITVIRVRNLVSLLTEIDYAAVWQKQIYKKKKIHN